MKTGLKKLLKACAVLAGGIVLVAAAAVMVVLLDKPLVKKAALRYLGKKTGITLTVGRLDYRLFPLSIEASSLKASYATPIYSLEVAARGVALKGDIMKLFRGEMPALETADIEITEVRVNQAKVSAEPVDLQSMFVQTARILGASRRLSLRCGRLVVLLPSEDVRLDNTALTITGGRAPGTFDAALSSENIAGAVRQGRLSFGGRLDADGELRLGRTTGFNLRLAVANPRMDVAGNPAEAASLTADIEGDWQADKWSLRFPRLALDSPGLASLTGTLDIVGGRNPSFEAEAKATFANLEALEHAAEPFLPSEFRPFQLRGTAGLEAKYSVGPGPESKKETLAALVKTEGLEWEYRGRDRSLRGRVSGTLKAEGSPADPNISGDLTLESGELSGLGAVARSAAGHLTFTGSKASAAISVPAAVLRDVSVAVSGGKSFAFAKIELSGTAGVQMAGRPAVVASVDMQLPGLAPVRLAGRFVMAPWGLSEASLESSGQEVPALRKVLSPFLPQNLAGWAADGKADISLKAERPGSERPTQFRADIKLSGGKFNDPDFLIASDGLRSRISVFGDYRPQGREISATATFELLNGESLWKRFYISWDKFPLKAELSGRLDLGARSLDEIRAQLSAAGLAEFHAGGRVGLVSPPVFDFQAGSRLSLEPALSLLSTANASPPGRPSVRGEAAADLAISKTSAGLTIKGRLMLNDVSVANSSTGLSIPGLSADLPLDLALSGTPAAPAAGSPREKGELRIGKVRTPGFELEIPPLVLAGSHNSWEVDPFALEIYGGRLEFGKTSLIVESGPLSLRGKSSLRLGETDLSRLPMMPAGTAIKGTLRADFQALDITPGEVRASGQAEADVFGGRVNVTNLAVINPFAADREIACDVDLLDLDLKKITDLVPFGEVTGIIRGEVRNMVIAYGQPEQFTLTLESVERNGVPRTFSLKAVDSLTVITAGQPATGGTGSFWLRFIKGFRDDKIGIRSTLKNDTFRIDGTIKENGVEYLVKRPPLSGISVINRNPGKTIGFKDMMSRLKRVGQPGPPETKSQGG